MILAFFWALLAELSLGEPNTWVLWTDLDGADFFWTSSNCSTTVVPDSGIVGNTPAVAPSNGGISDMIFFPDTHEVLWLEAGYLVRSWMDKTERRLLCQLPGDANATELENGNGTGAALGLHGEEGALAWTFWTSNELTAVMFFASKMTRKLWVATLTSIPPRDASHVGTWIEVIGASVTTSGAGAKPVLLAREGIVYWTDADAGGSFRSLDVPSALAGATATTLAQLGEGAWGEVHVAELTNDGRFLWIRQPAAETQLRFELILSLDALQEGPTSTYATGNVRTLYSFLDGDQPSGLAVQPTPGPGLPYRGNITQLYQQVYWSVSGPDTQARIDHLNMDTGQVSTLTYALGLERRGAAPVRPSALSVYPMPGVCVNVGCLYLRIWEECRICTVDQCDTCFLDTQDWVVKQWYASHGLFSNCIWLWPPQQGAWFVRNEVQQAKDEGLLPDDFVAQELPLDGATPVGEAVATVPPTRTATTATITSTVSSTSFTQTSTTSTSLTLSSTNPCVAIEVPDEGVLSDQSCSSMLDAWCQDSENRNINRSTLEPQSLRRDCATYPWSFKELCEARKLNSEGTQSDSCGVPLWSYVLFAAGLALMLAVLVPLCCYAIMRRAQPSRGHRGTGTISGLRHAARETDVGTPGPFEDSQSHWCCRHWTRYLRKRSERSSKSTESKVNDDERRKSWETIGLCDVDAVRSSRSAASNELETEPTEPETTMSIGSPRRADESVSSSTGDLQQILKGTWQPGISLSSAALAAGRLTNAMQKFMSSTRQGDKWRLLHDVEDILRTLGSALPGNLRSTAWAWHARQSGRLHRSEALHAAEEEAKSIAEDFREDLSSRLQSGVRLLDVAALTGAESLHSGRSASPASPLSPAVAARLQKASKLQISLDQLKTRMEELGSSKNLIRAGHLLDGYESLMRLSEELHAAREEAGAEDSDSEMDQLAKEMKQLQQALEEELEGSGLPPGAWQKITVDPDRFAKGNRQRQDPQASRSAASAWLKSLREATARAARFGHALKGSQGKERLSEMEKTLMEELKTCEAAAKAGDSEQSTSWKQLQKVWTQLQDQLDQVRKLQKLPGDGAEGGRLSSWAMSRSKLMPKRSHTQPLQMKDLSPELSVSAAELQVLQEEVEMFRKKLRGGVAAEDGNRLLMAGRRHLQQQDVEKLLRAAKAGASHSAALVDDDALAAGQDVSTQWQQLRSELEDLQAELALEPQRPGTSGRLSLGIGSRLSPKRGQQASTSSTSKSSGSLPLDLLEASSAFLRHSEELARIRSQQSEDDGSNPMLTLGQSIYTQQALESMELEVAKALHDADPRGDSEEWTAMRQLLQELHAGINEAKAQAAAQEQTVLPGGDSQGFSEEREADHSFGKEKPNKVGGNRSGAVHGRSSRDGRADGNGGTVPERLSSAEQQDLQQFLQTLQQSLKGDDLPAAARKLASICEKLGLEATKATKDTRSGEEANLRQAWSVSDEQGPSFGEGEDLAESLLPLLARLSSKERDALLSKMADLQRQVQAGDVSRKLEEICRQLGLECRGAAEFRHLNSQKNPETDLAAIAAAQKRMACLEEQLELQREGLQRQRRKSLQAPVVLAGHSLLHGSLLKAASKEHDQCRAECDRLQASDGMTHHLSAQSTALQQLLKGCEESSWHLSKGLLQVADSDATVTALLAALGNEPSTMAHLSAALQRLATLDDQLQQQRAALGARGRRRNGGLEDAMLTQFLQEKSEALSLLKDTAKDLLDEDSSSQVYDAWQSQLTSALEHVVATSITGTADDDGSPTQRIPGSPSSSPTAAMDEARRRLAALEAARAARHRRPRLKAGSTFAEHDPSWWQQLSEEEQTGDDRIHRQSVQERLRRHHEILQQWRRDLLDSAEQDLPLLAAKLAMHDSALTKMLENGALQLEVDEELDDLLRACRDAAQILSLEILEASGSDPTTAALLASADGLGETRSEPLDTALGRLGAWAERLEGQREAMRRGAPLDNALLASLAAERVDLLDWMEDHLDDCHGLPLRALLAERSGELEMMAGSAAAADPSDLSGDRDPFATKKKTFSDDDLLSELEEANRCLGRFDAELEKQRKGLQRRRKKGQEAFVEPELLASLVQERAALVDWAEDWLQKSEDLSLVAFRQQCRVAARRLEQLVMEDLQTPERAATSVDPSALLAEARRRLLMLEEEGNQRLRRRQRVLPGAGNKELGDDQDPLGTKKSRFDDHDWQSDLEEARRRLARFEEQLEEQRNGLQRRRKKGEDAVDAVPLPDELLTSLVSERAELVEWAEDQLQISGQRPSLVAFRQQCRDAARRLEQLVVDGGSLGVAASTVDPSALLAEARRRLILMEEEAARQRLKRRPRGARNRRATASSRLKVQDEDPQVLMADAARRLARLEEELESQRQGLCRRRLQPKTEAPEVQAAHALMHESAIEGLKDQRAKCRADCDRLLRAATASDTIWSPEQRATCNELQEKCLELEEAWNSCADTAELLKEEVAEAMPSRLTAILRRNPQAEASEALLEAMRRVASFDHELEQQRSLMQRRRKAALEPSNSVTAEDAILTALLEQRQAAAQCEEMAQNDEAWEDLHQLWRGPLTSSLLDLAADATAKTKVQRGTISAAEKNQALAEAQRRLERLDEESQRQRLGLKRRQKVAEAGRRELEKLVEGGTEFEHLAAEHREGLNHQQNNIKEVMASDVEPLEEIETWRQMVGLEELQAAAGKMSEQLATIEEGEEMAVENPEKRQKRDRTGPGGVVSAEERSAAKHQCQEMQVRLQEMRQDEEERQRLLMQRRQRKVKEPPEHAEKAARITEENSRDLLLKAHECITEGNPGDVQALRQQLHDLRADAFSESKEEPPRGADDTEPAEAASASVRPPPKEELEAALAASTERMDLVKSLGADLLSQLEAVFSSQEDRGDLASAVMNVVERWRGQLPRSHEASVPSDMYMEHMGAACEDAVKAVDESDVNARRAFLAAYRERMSAASQATQVQAEREEEGLRARAAARRKRRAQQRAEAESPSKTSPSASPSRFSRKSALARQSTVAFTTEAEVQNLRKAGEGFARSFFLQTKEEDEEQARRMVRRLESRSKSRSRPGTAAASPETSPLRRGLTRSLSMTASSWAFSP